MCSSSLRNPACSGDAYLSLPRNMPVCVRPWPDSPSASDLAMPKSMTFTSSFPWWSCESMMFSGEMSRWIRPIEWRCSRPMSAWIEISTATGAAEPAVLRDPLLNVRAVDVLPDHVVGAIVELREVVEHRQVAMLDHRRGARLLKKALQALIVGGDVRRA